MYVSWAIGHPSVEAACRIATAVDVLRRLLIEPRPQQEASAHGSFSVVVRLFNMGLQPKLIIRGNEEEGELLPGHLDTLSQDHRDAFS